MDKNKFIQDFQNAFGDYELPIAIWYSNCPAVEVIKTRGCFIKDLKPARKGQTMSFSVDAISCPGGKVYTGFAPVPPFLPDFVSEKERYKDTPEMVSDFISELNISPQEGKFISFTSISNIESFDNVEGIVFFASPDVMSGLVSWTLMDTNKPDALTVPFALGCSAIVAQTISENRDNGYRTFLGLFDPSVRPQVESNVLTLSIPMSRFKEMYYTFEKSCLKGTHAWNKVKERIKADGN